MANGYLGPRPGLVRATRPRPAMARADRVAVGGARQRGHAAADPGIPRRPRVPRPGWSDGRRPARWRLSPRARRCGSGDSSATRAGRSTCTRPHGSSRSGTAARFLRRERTCSRCQASGPTPPPRWRASRSASGTRCSTRTSAACWPGWSAARRLPPRTLSAAETRLAESLLPSQPAVAARWAVAVMELGALVCTTASPACARCPLAPSCSWRLAGFPAAESDGPGSGTRAQTGSAAAACWPSCAAHTARWRRRNLTRRGRTRLSGNARSTASSPTA